MGYTEIIAPRSEWANELKERGFILEGDLIADGAYHRIDTISKLGHRNASYRIVGNDTEVPLLTVKDFADPNLRRSWQRTRSCTRITLPTMSPDAA